MRLKYYLRGLGIGIICTAIIMGIVLSGNKKETLTDAEIMERARLLGMTMPEESSGSDEEKDDLEETDGQGPVSDSEENVNKQNSQNDVKNKADSQADDKSKDTAEISKDVSAQDKSNQQDSQPGETEKGEMIDIEVVSGDYSSTVSQKLFAAGLIDNAESFNEYMTQKGIDEKLHVGVYRIPRGATRDEIIDIFRNTSE